MDLLDNLLNSIEEKPAPQEFNLLDSIKKNVITFLDEHYHFNEGRYPSTKRLLKEFPGFTTESNLLKFVDEHINELLEARGLPFFEVTGDFLDPQFVAIVNVIVDPSDRRSEAAKLKEFGKTTRWWRACLRRRANREFFQKRVDAIFQEDVKEQAKLAVASLVEEKDLNAIKYYNEWTGAFAPKDQELFNLQLLVKLLMEILARHVTPDILGKVAEEIERAQPQLTQGPQ